MDFRNNKIHEDIQLSTYPKLLNLMHAKGYKTIGFDDVDKHDQFIILRHDIDLDVNAALKMARVEHDNNAKATYFFMLHNTIYNVWAKDTHDQIAEIISMGHDIGLHFDPTFYGAGDNMEDKMEFEIKILSEIFGTKVYYISFHQPMSDELERDYIREGVYESTYNARFTKNMRYMADSCGRWREEPITHYVNEAKIKKIQFLSHPILWCNDHKSTLSERLQAGLDDRMQKLNSDYRDAVNDDRRGITLI